MLKVTEINILIKQYFKHFITPKTYISAGHYSIVFQHQCYPSANSMSLCFGIHTQAVPVFSSPAF